MNKAFLENNASVAIGLHAASNFSVILSDYDDCSRNSSMRSQVAFRYVPRCEILRKCLKLIVLLEFIIIMSFSTLLFHLAYLIIAEQMITLMIRLPPRNADDTREGKLA